MPWVAPHLDANGWTVYSQPRDGASSGAGRSGVVPAVFYVSYSEGNNANNGLSPVANPSGAGGVGPRKTISNSITFTLSAPASVTAGAVYFTAPNGSNFIALETTVNSTTLLCAAGGAPSGGVLTKFSGTGPTSLNYTGSPSVQAGGWDLILQRGYGQHSWILFKMDDTWTAQSFEARFQDDLYNISGFSNDEPILVSCYDPTKLDASNVAIPYPYGSALNLPLFQSVSGSRQLIKDDNRFTGVGDAMHWYGLEGFNSDNSNMASVALLSKPSKGIRYENFILRGYGNGLDPYNQSPLSDPSMYTLHRCMMLDMRGQGLHGGAFKVTESIVDNCARDDTNGMVHNMYIGGYQSPFRGVVPWPLTILDGCIFSRSGDHGGSQIRSGVTLNNNTFLMNLLGAAIGNSGYASTLTYNVSMDPIVFPGYPPYGFLIPFQGPGSNYPYYQGDPSNTETFLIDSNIFAHSSIPMNCAFNWGFGAAKVTFKNTIVYQWNTSNPIIRDGARGVLSGHISNAGSGYTPRTYNITSIKTDSDPSFGFQPPLFGLPILTVPTSSQDNPWHTGEGGGYCYLTGTGIPAIDSKVIRVSTQGDPTLWWVNGIVSPGTFSGSATAYVVRNVSFDRTNGVAAGTGGTGSGFSCDVLVGPAGNVIFVRPSGNAAAYGFVGQNYNPGDVLASTTFGGSFTYTVDEVCDVTDGGGNWLTDSQVVANTPTAPDRTRTAGKYADFLLGGSGHTTTDFIVAARARMNKRDFNPLFLAASLNDYKRQGMGQAMVGSAYASGASVITLDALGPGTVGTAYSDSAFAVGGTAPYSYTWSGSTPPGLSLNPGTGNVTGNPTAPGTFSFTITAQDATSAVGSRSYAVAIAPSVSGSTYRTVRLAVS